MLSMNKKKKSKLKTSTNKVGGGEVLLYLTGSSVKAVRQELQLSDSTDLRGHLDHSDQLLAVQTPQMY